MRSRFVLFVVLIGLIGAACSSGDGDSLTVYSGRSEELIDPLIEQFEEATGIAVSVRYDESATLAATIVEEGDGSPADLFLAQDPASLGVVALADLFTTLPDEVTSQVPATFSDRDGRWVGLSGRARVFVYDATTVDAADLPATEDDLTDPAWASRTAIAPTNGSFLAFVAAKVLIDGEDATLEWLEAMAAAGAPTYSGNSAIVAAVDDGEVDAGLVNHYYLFRRIAEEGDVNAANHFLSGGSAASLVMPAGVGILASSDAQSAAERFVEFMLSADAQRYFADETFEYPLAAGVAASPGLPALDTLNPADVDLSELATALDTATDLVARAGLL